MQCRAQGLGPSQDSLACRPCAGQALSEPYRATTAPSSSSVQPPEPVQKPNCVCTTKQGINEAQVMYSLFKRSSRWSCTGVKYIIKISSVMDMKPTRGCFFCFVFKFSNTYAQTLLHKPQDISAKKNIKKIQGNLSHSDRRKCRSSFSGQTAVGER